MIHKSFNLWWILYLFEKVQRVSDLITDIHRLWRDNDRIVFSANLLVSRDVALAEQELSSLDSTFFL